VLFKAEYISIEPYLVVLSWLYQWQREDRERLEDGTGDVHVVANDNGKHSWWRWVSASLTNIHYRIAGRTWGPLRSRETWPSFQSICIGVVIINMMVIKPVLLTRWLTRSHFQGTVQHRKLIILQAIKPSQALCLKETSPWYTPKELVYLLDCKRHRSISITTTYPNPQNCARNLGGCWLAHVNSTNWYKLTLRTPYTRPPYRSQANLNLPQHEKIAV